MASATEIETAALERFVARNSEILPNSLELFGYWDEEYNCFVPLDVAQGLIDLDNSRIHFLPLYRKGRV